MTPTQLTAMCERRNALAEQLAILRAAPVPASEPKPGRRQKDPAKIWKRELEDLEQLIAQLDRLLPQPAGVPPVSALPRAIGPTDGAGIFHLARIPKGSRAEMRVSIKPWQGRQTVDIRLWYIPEGKTDFAPSRKGVAFDASKLPALLDALHQAVQFTPTGGRGG